MERPLIKEETLVEMWHCFREIRAGEKLLADMEKLEKERPDDPNEKTLKDAFGRTRHLQLGIPSGENIHRLYDVLPRLAKSVIIAHIADKKTKLIECNERARIELMDIPY